MLPKPRRRDWVIPSLMKTKCAPLALVTQLASRDSGPSCILETALAFELDGDADKPTAPEWVQIFPAGPELATVDGRKFKMTDAQAFVDAQTCTAASPILVDYDHLSSFMPEDNGDSTAAGWIEGLEVRNGEVWAKVSWTVRAAEQIAGREWRFVSPEFLVSKRTKEITKLSALSLVNRPAFEMTALARSKITTDGDTEMLKEIAKALGLSETASEQDVLAAIVAKNTELETARAAQITPSPDKYVPRADYDVQRARADAAEDKVKELEDEALGDEVDAMITAAAEAGKIAPASKEHYTALAKSSPEDMQKVKDLIGSLPAITAPSDLDGKDPGKGGTLTEEQKELCAQMGLSEEDYAAELARENG
ncbi:MAG: hypothetical protein CSA70_03640 [Rhodobacterales bacterium]|nr:MAG: hypothetical protein CSA70_03640 [Rhodobacterales bacterium]